MITWRRGLNNEKGYVGRIEAPIFTVAYDMVRKDGYKVYCELPGIKRKVFVEGDADAAKARAERMLARFLELAGSPERMP